MRFRGDCIVALYVSETLGGLDTSELEHRWSRELVSYESQLAAHLPPSYVFLCRWGPPYEFTKGKQWMLGMLNNVGTFAVDFLSLIDQDSGE